MKYTIIFGFLMISPIVGAVFFFIVMWKQMQAIPTLLDNEPEISSKTNQDMDMY